MAKPIELTFVADAKQLLSTTGNVEKSFQEVAGSLDKVAQTGKADLGNLGTSFKQYADTVVAADTKTNNSVALSTGQRKRLTKQAITEVSQQAKGSAAGVAQSFNGSVGDLATGATTALTGIVSAMGPVGLAVGTVAAIGFGAITAGAQKSEAEAKQLRADIGDLTTELIKTGKVGGVSLDTILTKLKALAAETDPTKVNLTKLWQTADKAGSSFKDLAQVYSGNITGLKELREEGEEHYKSLVKQSGAIDMNSDASRETSRALTDAARNQRTYNDYLDDAIEKAAGAAKNAKLYAKAGGPEMADKIALQKQLNSAYDDSAGSIDDFLGKESGLLDTKKYIRAMKARAQAIADYQKTLETSGLSDSAKSYLESLGADTAAQFAGAYKRATKAQKKDLDAIWTEAGKDNSGAYTKALSAGIPDQIDGPNVKLTTPNTAQWLRNLQNDIQSNRVKVEVRGFTRTGKAVF